MTRVDKKIPIFIAVAIIATVVVYLGLEYSQLFPTLFSASISSEEAISVIAHTLNLTNYNVNDFSTRYVYIKGDGSIFESNINSNLIGAYIGKTAPTITTGNYFAWEIKYKSDVYFLDGTTGEIILHSKTNKFG
ncbi:MAG TPA: hypothetical protein VFI73_03905 [Candidatus Nitrosopolaris sp.]|nr:hypothetical protein [Candidatus Nitrosopolaris sp.]